MKRLKLKRRSVAGHPVRNKWNVWPLLTVLAVFIVGGTVLLTRIKAATFIAGQEAELGVVDGNAAEVTPYIGASKNSTVRFGVSKSTATP